MILIIKKKIFNRKFKKAFSRIDIFKNKKDSQLLVGTKIKSYSDKLFLNFFKTSIETQLFYIIE